MAKSMICRVEISISPQQFCRFSASKRRQKSMAEFCPKPCPVRIQLMTIRSPVFLRKQQRQKQLKRQNIFRPARGDNRFKFRASAPPFISMKETAFLWPIKHPQTNYRAIAERIASIGASRLKQIENESAP